MDYKIRIVRYLYFFSFVGLLILYLFPGSLIGYLFYGDFSRQPDIIPNPLGTSINHTIAFFYLSILGLISYMRGTSFKQTLIFLVVVSLILELSHLIIPNRSFQYSDLFANLLGTLLAIVIIFLYKRLKNGKI
jgi:VanZ family protein|tara:strand:+ start:291 stop:689 length:399 start_codon:yes stop_codon:yes gene_type:complete